MFSTVYNNNNNNDCRRPFYLHVFTMYYTKKMGTGIVSFVTVSLECEKRVFSGLIGSFATTRHATTSTQKLIYILLKIFAIQLLLADISK